MGEPTKGGGRMVEGRESLGGGGEQRYGPQRPVGGATCLVWPHAPPPPPPGCPCRLTTACLPDLPNRHSIRQRRAGDAVAGVLAGLTAKQQENFHAYMSNRVPEQAATTS